LTRTVDGKIVLKMPRKKTKDDNDSNQKHEDKN
jgi:hypothetical protein